MVVKSGWRHRSKNVAYCGLPASMCHDPDTGDYQEEGTRASEPSVQ
jgi:hypothetical protein